MADEEAQSTPAKKKPPIKMIGVVAGLMLLEAVGVVLFLGMAGGGPQAAEANLEEHATDHESLVELALVADKFQNMQVGRVWIWDVEIFLKIKEKNTTFVEAELADRAAEITEGVSQIMRRAQHNQLKEPGLETLNRQLAAYVDKTLGQDPDGMSYVERVLIPKCRGFPADF